MKILISSVTRDFEASRHAAAAGVATLGHQAIRAEDFGASPDSPQQGCLAGVRDADAMILILGTRYGPVQTSGLSATHEEYREARDTRPVLAFVQQGAQLEPQQDEFIREVRGWEQGHFTAEFNDAEELRDKVIRALHDYVLANEAAPLDEAELASRARALVPSERSTSTNAKPRQYFQSSRPRTASAACRSVKFSVNCSTVTIANWAGEIPGRPRAP